MEPVFPMPEDAEPLPESVTISADLLAAMRRLQELATHRGVSGAYKAEAELLIQLQWRRAVMFQEHAQRVKAQLAALDFERRTALTHAECYREQLRKLVAALDERGEADDPHQLCAEFWAEVAEARALIAAADADQK